MIGKKTVEVGDHIYDTDYRTYGAITHVFNAVTFKVKFPNGYTRSYDMDGSYQGCRKAYWAPPLVIEADYPNDNNYSDKLKLVEGSLKLVDSIYANANK